MRVSAYACLRSVHPYDCLLDCCLWHITAFRRVGELMEELEHLGRPWVMQGKNLRHLTQHGTNHCNHLPAPSVDRPLPCQLGVRSCLVWFNWLSEASGICPADHQGHSRGASKSHGASEGRKRQVRRRTWKLKYRELALHGIAASFFTKKLPWSNSIIEAFWSLRAGAKKRSWPTAIVAPWTC